MKRESVEGLSNELRALAAIQAVERRGAAEANWVLLEGDYGHGKSHWMERHAVRTDSCFVRAKAEWTPKWALTDLGERLAVEPQPTTQRQFDAVSRALMLRQVEKGFCLMVDEINHCAHNRRVIETLRDLTDSAELIMIAGGNKGISVQLKKHGAIFGRIDQHVRFLPATVEDVKLICKGRIPDVKIADDAAFGELHRRTSGSLRLLMGANARVEASYKRNQQPMTLERLQALALLSTDKTGGTA
jgi:hypothetical protein